MDFANLIKALPGSVRTDLMESLDSALAEPGASRSEVLSAFENAVKLTKLGDAYIAIQDDEKRKMVDLLLTFVPHAGANALAA